MHMNRKFLVPKWVRITLAILAVANIAFGIMCYINPQLLFQNGVEGVDMLGLGAYYASLEYAARNLAIGIALLIVALVGVPESIAIVTIIRALVEFQGIIIGFITGNVGTGTMVGLVVLGVEILIIKTIFSVVAKEKQV